MKPSCNRFERQFAEASNNFMIKKYWRENQHYPYRTERILLEMLPHRKKIEIPNFRNTLQVDRLSWLARESWDKLEFAKWFNLTDIWNKVWNFLFWIHSNPPWYFLLSKYKFFKKCSFGLLGRFKKFTRYLPGRRDYPNAKSILCQNIFWSFQFTKLIWSLSSIALNVWKWPPLMPAVSCLSLNKEFLLSLDNN